MDFYTSDTHFGHTNIIKFADRPFTSTQEMDEIMVQRWNQVVSPDDTVYHLGDAIMGDKEKGLMHVKRLNGHKILIPGNHDPVSSVNKPQYVHRYWPIYLEAFQEIWPEIIEVPIGDRRVRLSHYPHHGDSQDHDRHVDKRPPNDGMPLIHGHVHTCDKAHGENMYHVGVDAHDFRPVSQETVIEWLDTLR